MLTFPKMEGIIFEHWVEVSEATHKLVDALATSRARVASFRRTCEGKGGRLTDEVVIALAVWYIGCSDGSMSKGVCGPGRRGYIPWQIGKSTTTL